MKIIIISTGITIILFFLLFVLFLHLFLVSARELDEEKDYMVKLESTVNIYSEFNKYNTHVIDVKSDYSNIRLNIKIYVNDFKKMPAALERYVSEHRLGYSRNLSVYQVVYEENRSVEDRVFSKTYIF